MLNNSNTETERSQMEAARVILKTASTRTRNSVLRGYCQGFYRKPLPAMTVQELFAGRNIGLTTVSEILHAREGL